MKTIKIILFFLAFIIKSFSQTNEEWKQYLKDSVYNSDNKDYIYLYTTKGGNQVKLMQYSLKKGKYVLATIYGDSTVMFKDVYSPNLFQIVYENYNILKELPAYIHSKGLMKNFRREFIDSNTVVTQLGIRYANFHSNHFPEFTEKQIDKTKKKKMAEAMRVINKLYAIFEELEK